MSPVPIKDPTLTLEPPDPEEEELASAAFDTELLIPPFPPPDSFGFVDPLGTVCP